jgi:hypothetical protein
MVVFYPPFIKFCKRGSEFNYLATPTFVPYMAHPSHLPDAGTDVELSLSSTWGRADQHTSHDSNRVWGVLFCPQEILGDVPLRDGNSTTEPFTGFEVEARIVLEQHLGEG